MNMEAMEANILQLQYSINMVNINMNSYGKEFSSTPKQMEHQKAMTQENHDYQLKMQKAQHDQEFQCVIWI